MNEETKGNDMTDILRRELAPISEVAWKEIDLQAGRILREIFPDGNWWTFPAPTAGSSPP
jgi:hypothetical protein